MNGVVWVVRFGKGVVNGELMFKGDYWGFVSGLVVGRCNCFSWCWEMCFSFEVVGDGVNSCFDCGG